MSADLGSIIAKVELGKKITQIALACPTCQGPVNKEIEEFKNNHLSFAHLGIIKGEKR